MVRLKCFHGTSFKNGQSILREQRFRPSDSDRLRMGIGAYFFCQAGADDTYPITCARELEKYHFNCGKHTDGYMILSCSVECDEESYLDLYDPKNLEYFHQMRYHLLNKSLEIDPQYRYHNAAVADTQVFDVIREIRSLSVIRCPQFFGMFEMEMKFLFDKKEHQFPKTYVPNVIMACVDTNRAVIKDIQSVERWEYRSEHGDVI